MKLRNGIETNKSLLVYFPEDVWHMILHKYLDIENYWRKCHMKYLRIFKPIQDDYVSKMCRMFCDNCSEYVKKCPTSYGADNKKCGDRCSPNVSTLSNKSRVFFAHILKGSP